MRQGCEALDMLVKWKEMMEKQTGRKIKEVDITSTGFEPRDWRFSLIDYALNDILLDDPKEAALSDEGLSVSTMFQ